MYHITDRNNFPSHVIKTKKLNLNLNNLIEVSNRIEIHINVSQENS